MGKRSKSAVETTSSTSNPLSSLSTYKPGDLSLLLNPEAAPEVYIAPPVDIEALEAAPAVDESNDQSDDEGGEDDHQMDGINLEDPEADLSDDESTDKIINQANKEAKRLKRQREDAEAESLDQPKQKKKLVSFSKADDERLPRTLFVGNVPVSTTRTQLLTVFKEYGAIESYRFRSFAAAEPGMPRKATMITKKFHEKNSSMNAYIVYKEQDSVKAALVQNGQDFHGQIIRVDYADASARPSNTDRSIFIGNLPFDVKDDQIRKFFSVCGDIESVRCVRDAQMNIGKGFAFVAFVNVDSVKKALTLDASKFENREIRVTKALAQDKIEKVKERQERALKQKQTGASRRIEARAKPKSSVAETEKKPFQGEIADPNELARRQRRLEKKNKQRAEIRAEKQSMVKSKTRGGKGRFKPGDSKSHSNKSSHKSSSNKPSPHKSSSKKSDSKKSDKKSSSTKSDK